jgi:hypothetical protein
MQDNSSTRKRLQPPVTLVAHRHLWIVTNYSWTEQHCLPWLSTLSFPQDDWYSDVRWCSCPDWCNSWKRWSDEGRMEDQRSKRHISQQPLGGAGCWDRARSGMRHTATESTSPFGWQSSGILNSSILRETNKSNWNKLNRRRWPHMDPATCHRVFRMKLFGHRTYGYFS